MADTVNVLLAVDLSASTADVVANCEQIAAALPAHVVALHVADPDPDFVGYEAGPPSVRAAVAERFRDEHRQIQQIAERLRGAGVDTTALLIQGATAATILREAQRLDARMIVIGSHGHGRAWQMLIGSVSEAVLREATCPVLVVPTRK